MKIAIVNNFFTPRVGGSSLIAEQLARKFTLAGHEVLVITGEYNDAPLEEECFGFRIVRVSSWILPKTKFSLNFDINFTLVPGNQRRVNSILRDFAPNLIHCHGQFLDLTWKALKFASTNSVPTVLTLHTRLVNPKPLSHFLLRILDLIIVKPIMSSYPPNKVLIIDKDFEGYALKRYGFSREKLSYISIGVNLEKFQYSGFHSVKSKMQPIVILSIGHIIPIRNRIVLIKALPIVLAEYPNLKVRIIGDDYHNEALKIARELKVDESVELVGSVPSEMVALELKGSTLEIHDVQGFGIGIATLESMAAGVPTIIYADKDYFPHAPLIENKHFLQLVAEDPTELGEIILASLEDERILSEISENARNYVVDNFDMDVISRKHLELFCDLIG